MPSWDAVDNIRSAFETLDEQLRGTLDELPARQRDDIYLSLELLGCAVKAACARPEEEVLCEGSTMVKVSGKSFRCDCGGNVFRQPVGKPDVFVCNSCDARYRGER